GRTANSEIRDLYTLATIHTVQTGQNGTQCTQHTQHTLYKHAKTGHSVHNTHRNYEIHTNIHPNGAGNTQSVQNINKTATKIHKYVQIQTKTRKLHNIHT